MKGCRIGGDQRDDAALEVVVRELQIVQAGVGAAARQQFRVRSALANLAVFQDQVFYPLGGWWPRR